MEGEPGPARISESFWPSPNDYVIAVQNPSSFVDPLLRYSKPSLNKNNLPIVLSGDLACTFKFSSNGKDIAIRCFLRPTTNHKERYQKLAQYLSACNLPFFVNFRFIEKGIDIRGKYYPVVVMDWIEGQTLDIFVAKNLSNNKYLLDLSDKFRLLIDQLQMFHIAHGDLQHSSIIVTKNLDIKLVDYDGMYIPDFKGQHSRELGHRNYQHYWRTYRHYNEKIDNFSALIIYLSLRAIAFEPSLFQRYYDGSNLIFNQQDFMNPNDSEILKHLERSRDKIISHCIGLLKNGLVHDPDSFPSLRELLQ